MSSLRAHSTNKSSWLLMLIGISLFVAIIVSTSALVYASHSAQTNQPIPSSVIIDKVFVDKSERILQLLSADKVVKSYHIALGDSPVGHKQQQGDERTPTGIYVLDYTNENSKFYRSIHISYPNAADKAQARKLGVSPGGDIMIHGQTNGYSHLAQITQQRDWTDGCIAVSDDEMDEIMAVYQPGMTIEIVE